MIQEHSTPEPAANAYTRRPILWGSPLVARKLRGDLKMNRGSLFLVWLIFTLGLTFFGGTYPAGKNFSDSITRVYERTHLADLWFDLASAPAAIVEAIRAVPGVAAASGRIVEDMGMQSATALVTLRAISLPASEADVNNIVLLEGRLPAADSEIALVDGFAAAQGLSVGDTLRLTGAAVASASDTASAPLEVEVVGLVSSGEYLIESKGLLQPFPSLSTFGVGYLTYDTLAAYYALAGEFNSFALTLTPDADLDSVRGAVSALLTPYDPPQVVDRGQFAAYATLNANVNSNTQVGLVFAFIFLLGSGSVMLVLLTRKIDAERRSIGTLRAMGYSRVEIVTYYLVLALLIAITGSVVAIPAGYGISIFMIDFFQSGLVRAAVPFSSNTLNWPFILMGIGISATMALLGAVVPAWRAATTDPGLALRPPSPSALSWLARLPLPGPKALRHTLRDMLRVPSRSIGTVIGTVSGMALIVLCFSSWDTMNYGFNTYFDSHAYDFVVTLSGFDSAQNLANRVSSIAGVTGVETGLIAPVQVELAGKSYTALGIVLEDDQTFTWFDTLEGTPAMSSNAGVWLGHNLSRVLDARPGDTLTVTAQGITQQVEVEGIFNQALGSPMIIPMSLFMEWMPLHLANQAYIRVDPAGYAAAQDALNRLPGIIGVEDWQNTTQDIQRSISFNSDNAKIFLLLGMILTFVVLFNSITSNLQDRSTELAIMRMQGFSKGEINRRVTLETGLTLSLGILLGIVPTLILVDYVMRLYNTDVAGMLPVTFPASWVIAVILLVIIALVSQWLSMRQVYRINLGDVSKAVGV